MLEPLVDAWEEEPSSDIKMHLLTAAVKLFFKRPPEMQVCAAHGVASVPFLPFPPTRPANLFRWLGCPS